MRIIAGEYSSRRIDAPKGNATRPTLDKVREAVFSSLGTWFEGGCFLDLYAGSGANGFEALSRGMDNAVFCDISGAAMAVIKNNAKALGCTEQCRFLHMKDTKALQILNEEGMAFDLIYLDPPYMKQHNADILLYIDREGMLKEDGRIVIESSASDAYEEQYGSLMRYKEVRYGITKISYYRRRQK